MATPVKRHTTDTPAVPVGQSDEIVITQVVARIPLSVHGTVNPLVAAFEAIGQWMPENLGPGELNLQFNAFDRTFNVSVNAAPPLPEVKNPWDEEDYLTHK